MKWRPCPSEDGGLVKMDVPWLKLQAILKKYCGSIAENGLDKEMQHEASRKSYSSLSRTR